MTSERWAIRPTSAVEGLQTIHDGTVAHCTTSPPYKDSDGFTWELMEAVFGSLLPKLQAGALTFVNFGHLAEDKLRPHRLACLLDQIGYELVETIIWRKNHYTPLPGRKRLNGLYEFLFAFVRKGERWDFDRLSIGVPYADVGNVDRFAGGINLRCGGNVWDIDGGEVWDVDLPTIQRSATRRLAHQFPLELPARTMRLSHLAPDSLVVDPFCGGGTSGEAALRLGHRFIGCEINPATVEVASEWLAKVEAGAPPEEPAPSLDESPEYQKLPPERKPPPHEPKAPKVPEVDPEAKAPEPEPTPPRRRRRTLGGGSVRAR